MGNCIDITKTAEDSQPESFYHEEHLDLNMKFELKEWNFENLAFEGGGVKGIAYAGALKVLEENGLLKKGKIKGVAGTSAGAIVAAAVACGYTSEEIHQLLEDLDFSKFKDDTWGIVGDAMRFFKDYALYKGDVLKEEVRKIINAKFPNNPDPTFEEFDEIMGVSLCVVASCIDTKRTGFFSKEYSPTVKVYEAVYASMAIPFYFKPAYISVPQWFGGKELMFVDGGLLDNMPCDWFDPKPYMGGLPTAINPLTLGLRLDSHSELTAAADSGGYHNYGHQFKDFGAYALRLYEMMSDYTSILRHTAVYDHSREIVAIDTLNYSATDFNLNDGDKQRLYDEGVRAALHWLLKHGATPKPREVSKSVEKRL